MYEGILVLIILGLILSGICIFILVMHVAKVKYDRERHNEYKRVIDDVGRRTDMIETFIETEVTNLLNSFKDLIK